MAGGRRALLADPLFAAAAAAGLPAILLLAVVTPLRLGLSWPGPAAFAVAVVAAPLLEEIVFRWGLQDALAAYCKTRFGPFTLANLATAALFCLLHLWRHPPAWALATFVPALVFGLVYERQRRLAAPVALHAFYNAAYLLLLLPAPR